MVGPGDAPAELRATAEEVGRALAARGAVVVTGGLGGVMETACRGAREEGASTVGILPGLDRRDANPHVEIAVPTGLGEARNALIARAADALIAVGGGYGTLSEVALALKGGKRVVGIDTWQIEGVVAAASAEEAVAAALDDSS